MSTFVPWRFGAVTALTVLFGYAVCTALWLLFSEPSIAFMNALFHGLDFRPLYGAASFDLFGWIGASAVLSGWAFLIGVVFALLVNRMRVERSMA